MNKSLLLIISSLSTTALLGADTITGVVSTGVQSEYLARIGTIFSDSPIAVTIVEAEYKDWYLGIWNSTGLNKRQYGATYADEWDLYGGWAHTFGPVRLDLGGAYFGLAQLKQARDDIWIIEQELSVPKFPFVQPYIRSRYFGSVDAMWRPGWFIFSGLRKTIDFGQGAAKRPYSLCLDASTAYGVGALRDFNGFVYARFSAKLDIPLSKKLTVGPNMIYQVAAPGQRSDPNGFTDGNKFIFGGNFRWTF